MNLDALNMFLSDGNIKRHLDYLLRLRLQYSILEKSVPKLKGCSMSNISRLNIDRDVKDEALSLMWKIKSHECFFDSFDINQSKVSLPYTSTERLLYDIYTEAVKRDFGFLYIFESKQSGINMIFSDKNDGAIMKNQPILALDLYEHTYFWDYGFDKKRFLQNALPYLRLSSLDKNAEKGYNKT